MQHLFHNICNTCSIYYETLVAQHIKLLKSKGTIPNRLDLWINRGQTVVGREGYKKKETAELTPGRFYI